MDQVFNELSLGGALPDRYAAMDALLDVYHASMALERLGLSACIRITEDFSGRSLARNYTVHEWKYDRLGGKNHTLRTQLLGRLANAPYTERLCEEEGITDLHDYRIQDEACKGLALAHLWRIPALSLRGDTRFTPPAVEIVHDFLEEGADEPESELCRVPLICRADDVLIHAETVKAALNAPLCDGPAIWEQARAVLPCLEFCDESAAQLQAIGANHLIFSNLRDILISLNEAMVKVKLDETRIFSPKKHKVKYSEGKFTSSSEKTTNERTFIFPDGELRVCEPHMRINKGWRVHFYSDLKNFKVYIGYIGKHLSTKKY